MYTLKRADEILATSPDSIVYVEDQAGWRIGPAAIYYDPDKSLTVEGGPGYRTRVTRTEYLGLFRPDEEAIIRIIASQVITHEQLVAASGDDRAHLLQVASLAVMVKRADDRGPGDLIDLADPQTVTGLDLLAAMGLLSADRIATIKLGVPA